MKVLNILIRRCVLIARFEETVSFYENLIAQKARLRFDYPEYDLKTGAGGFRAFNWRNRAKPGSFSRHRGHFSWSTTLPPGRNICLPPGQRLSTR
ncbi:glyoxalase [Klebsiella pneumoniae]|uniref:Glyoxalase n=1 Tax=Klebsiella pneumoniae TaxID=573 RepID=A0A447RJ76_KLEPN|nr:glyoxalase [Klebsiella pneumoniae]